MEVIGAISSKSVKMKEEVNVNGVAIVEDDNCSEEGKSGGIVENDTEEDSQIQYEMIETDDRYRIQFTDVEEVPQPGQGSQTFYSDPINGRIFLIGPSHDVFPMGQKTTVTRGTEESTRQPVTRDDKRRATHNEVERRRRDKINYWIMKLGKIIPECKQDSAKGGFESQSKGGILAKACDYITELRETNERLLVYAKENEQLLGDIENLSTQHEQIREENARLKGLLRQAGISSLDMQ